MATDETYTVVVGEAASRTDGQALATPRRYSFTTQTAPTVADFQVRLADVPPAGGTGRDCGSHPAGVAPPRADDPTAKDVSATSAYHVSFSDPMDRADVEGRFAISPAVKGTLAWKDDSLMFTPWRAVGAWVPVHRQRHRCPRYDGNVLGGKGNLRSWSSREPR